MNEEEEIYETDELDKNVEKVGIPQGGSVLERYTKIKEQFPEYLALIRVSKMIEIFIKICYNKLTDK